MKPVHATITDRQWERLIALRDQTGIAVSEVLRRLIDGYLHKLERALTEQNESLS